MRRISLLLTALILSVAILGAITAKSNERRRTQTNVGYIVTRFGVTTVTLSQAIFDDSNVTNQATLILNNGIPLPIWKNINSTVPLKLIP